MKITLAATALLAAFAGSAFADDIVPLQRGFYVKADTHCRDASNATLDLFLGHAFRLNCTVKSVQKTADGYRVEQSCEVRGQRETEAASYRILSRTEYIVAPHGNGNEGLSNHYRYCPQSDLPEPWRSNDIGQRSADAAAGQAPALDDAYISIFWKVDGKGVLDVRRNEYVFTAKALDKGSKVDLGKSFTVRQRVTAKDTNGKPLEFERIFARSGQDYVVLTQTHDIQQQSMVVTPVAVLSPTITDSAGVNVGAFLSRVRGYNWKRLCSFGEGMLICLSPHSTKVSYDLGDEATTGRGTIENMLARMPVRKILISAF